MPPLLHARLRRSRPRHTRRTRARTDRAAREVHPSIVDKLKRWSIRLTQVQDIAGCRIVVADIIEQESVIQALRDLFPQANVIDRRVKPSYGYRAVHLVVNQDGKLIEIQVRTKRQHSWAEMSEKLSDIVGSSVKYGGGNEGIRQHLQRVSELYSKVELLEKKMLQFISELSPDTPLSDEAQTELREMQKNLRQYRQQANEIFDGMDDSISKLEEESDDISN